jgi:membrane fusion protein, multidrug efflux system
LKSPTPKTLSLLGVLALALATAGCGKKDEPAAAAAPPKPAAAGGVSTPAGASPTASAGAAAAAPAPAAPKPGTPVRAVPVKLGEVQSEVTAVGSILADESVIIRPEIDGRIVALPFNEGQAVPKGAKLVQLDASEYEAQMASSESQERTARQRFDRTQELFAQKFVSQDALDIAKNELKRAEAKVREDKVRVDRAAITAPFSGIVGVRLVSPGAYVKKGDDIVRLENISTVKLDFRVPEGYLSRLKSGQSIGVRVDAYPSEVFTGKVYALEPVVDEKTRTILLRARVPNQGTRLRPGMFARVSVLLETRTNAVLIPEQAIWPQGRESFVYRVVDGKAALTKVQLGERRPGEVEVLKGLAANDVVVTDGQIKIKDGAGLTVLPSTPAATASGTTPKPGS